MKKILLNLGILSAIFFTGCTTSVHSLQENTAGVLGYSKEEIEITNIRENSTSKYYIAKTPKGEYACTAQSDIVTTLQYGFTNPPVCNKK